ncbi:RNA polymerase sigma-70 factor [Thermoflavifilum aggregans]|nr:RNA polymerase sigma-70 factor [Thermoflavifilum aggregans]
MMHSYSLLTTEELLHLFQEDDPEAFEELYKRYWFRLYISAYKRLHLKEAAEEAVQTLFESLWKNRHHLHIHTSLENYLFASLRYIVLKMLYQQMETAMPEDLSQSVPLQENPEQEIISRDLQQYIQQIVNRLPERCRQVYQLSREEMKTHKEIARLMGISEKTVENQITKALRIIKTQLHQLFSL